MKDPIGNALLYTAVFLIILTIGFSGWYLKRYINGVFYYDDSTRQVVCEMVKPEYLKEGVCKDE